MMGEKEPLPKAFGEAFSSYEPLGITRIALPNSKRDFDEIVRLGVEVKRDQLPEIAPAAHRTAWSGTSKPATLCVLRSTEISDDLEEELTKIVVEVAPTSNVYKFQDQHDLSKMIKNTLPYYDYYLVELGLNVVVRREAKIPSLAFDVDLQSDGSDRTDVTAYDVMPRDEIKRVKIIQGKVSLGITNLLNLIPGPVGKLLPNLLSIDINPWKFKWTYEKCLIDTTGPKSYHIYWRLYETDVVQGFNPTMILKVRKPVSNITAVVRATYRIKTGRLLREKEVHSDEKPVRVLPI
jgi:hypothetical protein